MARLLPDASHVGIKRVLDRLFGQGLVTRETAGGAHLYTLNRRHIAAPAVEILANLRAELVARLRERVGGWELQPIHASIFGSAARATGDAASDIDLFVVVDDDIAQNERWEEQLDDLADDVRAWTGNPVQLLVVSATELAVLRARGEGLLQRIHDDAVDLAGQPARML